MKQTHQTGLSMFQTLGLILVLGLVAAYGVVFMTGLAETQDAQKIETTQVALQSSLSQGMATLEMAPTEIHPANIINAARSDIPKGVRLDNTLHLKIPETAREAQFEVTQTGDLKLVTIRNFTRYHVRDGRIVRHSGWGLSLSIP